MVENPDPAQGIPKLFGEEIKSFPKVIVTGDIARIS
jgi:hypothetical protein